MKICGILKSCIELRRFEELKFSTQALTFGFALLIACVEEEQKINPIAVQFTTDALLLTEGTSTLVTLPFRSPAPRDGSVQLIITSDATYGQDYLTIPAPTGSSLTLTISKGQRFLQFQVAAPENNILERNKTVTFSLQSASQGFRLGSPSTLNVTVADNEHTELEPPQIFQAMADLSSEEGRIAEQESSGIGIKVNLSKFVDDDYGSIPVPATGTGSVTLKFASGHATYGKEFTTVPAATGDSLVINFAGNQTDSTITVIPIDNSTFTGSRFVSVRISKVTGGLERGQILKYWLEIVDNETGPAQITWTKLESPPLMLALSMVFQDENNGYIVNHNRLVKTTDGGLHWTEVTPDPAKNYSQLIPYFVNDQIGFASALEYDCDYDYYCDIKSTIFKTINGGASWTRLTELGSDVTSVYFISESIGLIGMSNGEIQKTDDGGTTWYRVAEPTLRYAVYDFVILANGTGYARAGQNILKTSDSGESWITSFISQDYLSINSLSHSSTNSVYASLPNCPDLPSGFSAIYKSDDGTNWSPTSECILTERLSFSATGSLGVSSGRILGDGEWQSVIYISRDNGSSWILESMPYAGVWNIAVASDQVIYAVGNDGEMLRGVVE
ncbi:MAG TPA: hypothetical protein VF141_04210 [Chryseolinea sp.]